MDNLSQVYATKCILGVDGISARHGCTVPSNAEAEVIRQMIKQTKGEIIVVADHSKWGVVSNFQIAALDEINKLITDAEFDRSAFESLEMHGVQILVAAATPAAT
jgi:DeoR/GlpR family transcriptional regulator of sugar metabolism